MQFVIAALLFLLTLLPAFDASAAGTWTTLTNPDYVTTYAQEGDTLWCATQGGIVRYDRSTDTFRVFTRDDGLLSNMISGAFIFPDGRKWYSISSYLVRSDGASWKYFSPADADTLFEAGSWMRIIALDKTGAFILEGRKNQRNVYVRFDGETWTECPLEADKTGTSTANPDDFWLMSGSIGSKTMIRFDGKKIMVYNNSNSLSGYVRTYAKDHDKVLWLLTDEGIVSYDCTEWKKYTDIPELGTRTLGYAVFVDRSNRKWFSTDRGFITFDGSTWEARDIPGYDPASFPESFCEDRAGNLWFGTRRGLWKFDGLAWQNFTHDIQVKASTSAQSMAIIGEDSKGRIWFYYSPLFHPGLFSFDGTGITYHSLRTGPAYNWATSVTVDQNNTKWFGFTSTAYLCRCYIAGGISAYDGHTWKQYSTDDGLYFNRIKSLAVDRDGVLWAGTDFSHICWLDGETWKVNHDAYAIPDGMYSIAVDKNNVKWFTAPIRGIMRYDGAEWKLLDKTSGIPDIKVRSLAVDRNNILWAGATGGIWSYDGSAFKSYTMADGLPDSLIACAAVDSANVKWFGSQRPAGGLVSFDGKIFRQYTTEDGLIGNVITAITVDKNNVKWVGTNVGVSRFDGVTFTNYTTADGLTSNNVTSIAVDHDGIVWIGTNDGISRFEPDNLTTVEDRNAKPAALSITGNYPNPFNPSTTISFTLPASGKTTLAIYDITGRKVRTLVSGSLPAGAHTTVWDGRDERGKEVSSGVYIAQLRAGKAAVSRRMLLMK